MRIKQFGKVNHIFKSLFSNQNNKKEELEVDENGIFFTGSSLPQDLVEFTEEEKQMFHDAEMEDFHWEQKLKHIERTAPISVFITQEELNAESTKEEEVIEQILSAAYFPERRVDIYINTYGGDVHTMYAIIDAINSIPNETRTIGIGKIMSAGGPILLAGKIRCMTRNSFLMIHDISGGAMGSPEEIEAELDFIKRLKEKFIISTSQRSNLSQDKLRSLTNQKRNHYFDADEALELGLIDEIIG